MVFRIAPRLVFQTAIEVVVLCEAAVEVVQPETVHHEVVVIDAPEIT